MRSTPSPPDGPLGGFDVHHLRTRNGEGRLVTGQGEVSVFEAGPRAVAVAVPSIDDSLALEMLPQPLRVRGLARGLGAVNNHNAHVNSLLRLLLHQGSNPAFVWDRPPAALSGG